MGKELFLKFESGKNQFRVKFPKCWDNKKQESKERIVGRFFEQLKLDNSNSSFSLLEDTDVFDFTLDSNGCIKKSQSPYFSKLKQQSSI